MDLIEKIAIGFLIFVLTSVVAYLFKARQLYAAEIKLYGQSVLSTSGSLVELVVCNRGKQVEEEVSLEFHPDVKAELVATSTNVISLSGQALSIPRLHRGEKVSVMVLIEDATSDGKNVARVTSKQTTGTLYPSVEKMPGNFATAFIFLSAFICFSIVFFTMPRWLERAMDGYAEVRREVLVKKGWSNLRNYHWSKLASSYEDGEFPVSFQGLDTPSQGVARGKFLVVNKTALPLKFGSDIPDKKVNPEKIDLKYYSGEKEVAPMDKLLVSLPIAPSATNSSEGRIGFYFRWDGDFIYEPTLVLGIASPTNKD